MTPKSNRTINLHFTYDRERDQTVITLTYPNGDQTVRNFPFRIDPKTCARIARDFRDEIARHTKCLLYSEEFWSEE